MAPLRTDVTVLGAGIIGMAVARAARAAGATVAVFDSGAARRPATLAAAGLLAPLSHKIEPGVRADACFASRSMWPAWRRELVDVSGIEVEFDQSGAFIVGATEEQQRVVAEVAAMAEALGERVEEPEVAEVLKQVPDLRPDLGRALHLPDESRVDNVQTAAALEEACRREGIAIERGWTALGVRRTSSGIEIDTNRGTLATPRAVLATGSWAGLVEGCQPLPVRPVRGQMIRTEGAPWPWRGMIRLGSHYAVRRSSESVLFGATVEEVGFDDRTTESSIDALTAAFRAMFPGLADEPVSSAWSGLRPASEDALPIVGPWRDWPLFIAGGHFRDGILLAPWTAECARRWLEDAAWQPPTELSPGRFSPRGVGL